MRVLIVSHAHPERVAGGAQLLAHRLFRELRQSGIDAWFLAYDRRDDRLATFSAHKNSQHEMLFHATGLNSFLFSHEHMWFVWHDFAELLARVRPDVVHFQHYANVGVDLIRAVRNANSSTALVLTLHEYLAICHNNGQMVKRKAAFQLCRRADPRSCNECFPEIPTENFFLRYHFIRSHFDLIDSFIAPSEFLKSRYVEWGLPAEKIQVTENAVEAPQAAVVPREVSATDPIHFAFCGKAFTVKGIFVLLGAIEALPSLVRDRCRFSIFGAGIEEEASTVQSEFQTRVRRLSRWVRCHGHYDPEDLDRLLSDVDWMVVPSLWWENSPLVIQEALARKIPVICSDVGGMAEKVSHGVNGLHFRINDPLDLARVLQSVVKKTGLRSSLVETIQAGPSMAAYAAWHVQLYERLTEIQRTEERTVGSSASPP